ncbi:MAG: aldehyde ferredoxin oxidoreductase family protein [Chloroflexi bacterium]|nr:aldehyde ferredoxin oxidoreductase family protein [Chloroflexota bacterium]
MTRKTDRVVLRIDVGTGKIQREIIAEEDVRTFMGGRVLGDKFLYEEMAPGIDALSPKNKILLGVGPLTGTSAPGTSRYAVHTKSPLTGLFLSSVSGGYFGPEFRRTGHDLLVIEGSSEKPVYILILDDKVEIKDAKEIWGMPTDATQEFIKEESGSTKIRVACIGPAGERQIPYASIVNERRVAGRGGAGAVMGSKNLKAMAVGGSKQVEVADHEAFKSAVKHAFQDISKNPRMREGFTLYGSNLGTSPLVAGGIVPWRNWQNGTSAEAKELFPETWRKKFVKKDVRCAPPCNVKCSKINLVTEGRHAGAISEGPDYETVYSFGACCDVSDIAAVIEADSLCDRYGLDTISMGVSIAFAMECYEKGIINRDDLGGEELRFGRSDLFPKLVRDTAYRQGFGELLSMGTKRMAQILGKGSDAFAMHAKGMEIAGYDPRGAKSVALVYACGPRGGCHKTSAGANSLSMAELRTGEARFSNQGKAALTKASGDKRVLSDSMMMCVFVHGSVSNEASLELLNAATGFGWSQEEAYAIAERGSNLERLFNVREGLRRSWDTLPARLLCESPGNGPNKGQVVELEGLVDDYYRICGWDVETGIPTREKLRQLGLEELLDRSLT